MTISMEDQKLAHRETIKLAPEATAEYLQDVLGQKLLAYMVDVTPKTVGRWADGDRSPRQESADRLQAINYIFRLLGQVESSHTARAWFAGMNPLLDDEAPATNIRNGKVKEAIDAAKAFATDG